MNAALKINLLRPRLALVVSSKCETPSDETGGFSAANLDDTMPKKSSKPKSPEQLARELHKLAGEFIPRNSDGSLDCDADWRKVPEYVMLSALAEAVKYGEVKKLQRAVSECRRYGESYNISKGRMPMFLPRKYAPQLYREAVDRLHDGLHGEPHVIDLGTEQITFRPSPRMAPIHLTGASTPPHVGVAEGYVSEILYAIDPKLNVSHKAWLESLNSELTKDPKTGKLDMRTHNWNAENVIDKGLRASGVTDEQIDKLKATSDRVLRKKRNK